MTDNLSRDDHVALVAYNNHVHVLVPLHKAVNREYLHHRIDELFAEGYTNLSAGLLEGCSQVRKRIDQPGLHHVILLTDGTLDVWEGSPDKTAKQYQKYVEEWKNDPQLRTKYHVSEYLTIQAQEMLLKETAPAMVKRAKEIFITPVFFQRTAEKVDLSVLEALGKMGAKPHPLIDSRGGNLFRDVFLKIITLRPGQVWQNRSVYGYQLAEKLPADQPYSRKIHVYGGTRDTRLCLFADSPAFTAQVLNPNNIAGFDPTKVIERGRGKVYRILELGDIPTGDYELQLTGQPDADKKLTKVETAIFSEFQVRPRVKLLGEKQIFQLGDTATFEIALLGKDDQVVTDKDFLSELTAEVIVTRPNGDEDKQVIRFAGKDEARVEYLLEFTGVGGEGQYKLDVRFGGVGGASGGPLDVGGGFGLQAKADLMQLNVLPALRMKLEPWEPLRAQKITLEQAELVGYVADPASVKAEAHFAREGAPKDEPLLTVPLIYDATAWTWSAEMAFPQAGDWEFLISTNETLAVQSAGKEIISVRERTLTVTPSPWQPDLKYWEEHSLEQTFDLKLDLAPGETATVTVTVESRLIAWERAKIRRYTNEDQQQRFSGDKFLEFVNQTMDKEILWGVGGDGVPRVQKVAATSDSGIPAGAGGRGNESPIRLVQTGDGFEGRGSFKRVGGGEGGAR
ncbi:MAG: VWA domain-containing protein [Proteobacteria bacterium]|nr:VWA domain-containing protein [Pseudomonadota bacterium]